MLDTVVRLGGCSNALRLAGDVPHHLCGTIPSIAAETPLSTSCAKEIPTDRGRSPDFVQIKAKCTPPSSEGFVGEDDSNQTFDGRHVANKSHRDLRASSDDLAGSKIGYLVSGLWQKQYQVTLRELHRFSNLGISLKSIKAPSVQSLVELEFLIASTELVY